MRMRGGWRGLVAPMLVGAALSVHASGALAEGPADAARAAIERTQQARSARLAVSHRFVASDRVLEQRVHGSFAAGDHDVVADGEAGRSRQVAVGRKVYERHPDEKGAPWHASERPAPSSNTVFGPLTLVDGTHVADPKLYRSSTSHGIETLPQGEAEKLVLELDMRALAVAMQLSGSEAERLTQMQGTLTLWVKDGTVVRNAIRLVIPGEQGQSTLETTIDLTDLDAPIAIAPPTDP